MLLERLVIPVGFDTGLLLEGLNFIKDGLTSLAKKTFDWADNLDQLGDVTGMSGQKLAAWSYIAKKAGVPVDSLSKGLVILEKGLVKSDGTLDIVGKSLKDWGINVKDSNGQVKDQSVLMDELVKKYESFATQQQRVDFLTEVFGRSGADLVDVFDTLASEGGIDAVTKKVESLGLVLDSNQFEGFNRILNEIGVTFTGLANTLVGPLLPGVTKIVDKFKEWLQSPWVINTLKGVGETLGTLMDDIAIGLTTGDWSKFWGDVDSLWQALKEKVSGALNKAADWIRQNGPFIITDAIFGLFGMKVEIPSDKLIDSAGNFVQSLGDALSIVPWDLVGQVISSKLGEQFSKAGIDPKVAEGVVGTAAAILAVSAVIDWITRGLAVLATVVAAVGTGLLAIGGGLSKVFFFFGPFSSVLQVINNNLVLAAATSGSFAGTLGALALGVLYVVGVLGLWIATIAFVIQHHEELGKTISNLFGIIKFQFGSFSNFLTVQKIFWGQVFGALGGFFETVKTKAGEMADFIVEKMKEALNWIFQVLNLLPGVNIKLYGNGGGSIGAPIGAKAGGGSASGLTWVGERGAELLNLPSGSQVYSHEQSMAMTQIDYEAMGRAVARHLIPALQAAGMG